MMKNKNPISFFLLIVLIGIFVSCADKNKCITSSPDGRYHFEFQLDPVTAEPCYSVKFMDKLIVKKSALGIQFQGRNFSDQKFKIISISYSEKDTVWNPAHGEQQQYRDHYHQNTVILSSHDNLMFRLEVRAYNEGIAFRYHFDGRWPNVIEKEFTEFSLPENSIVWASTRAQSPVKKMQIQSLPAGVERPLLAQLQEDLFLAIGEAALVDFSRMKFALSDHDSSTVVTLLDSKVNFDRVSNFPWRYVMAGKNAGEILENNFLLLNLNEPCEIEKTDWIRPGKVIREVTLTTQGGMACVDFAANHNLQYVEFDAGWYGNEYDESSDATTITVDPKRSSGPLDLHQVIEYAEIKGIGIILYVNRRALEKQIDEVLPTLQSWGVKGVKYGFVQVGSQEWTSWLHEAVRKAAKYQLMVDIHDEYRPTGYSRTFPNLMTQEGIRGDEESPDNAMVINTIFTRMIAGAGDQTNCYFAERVSAKMGSHASQLAKAICIYSPWQFLYWYDRPKGSPAKVGGAGKNEYYIQDVPELAFFDGLPTTWDDTKVLAGYPGEYAVIARKKGTSWYIGVLNGNRERNMEIPLDFLSEDHSYSMTLYVDDPDIQSPTQINILHDRVTHKDMIHRSLMAQSGMAAVIQVDL